MRYNLFDNFKINRKFDERELKIENKFFISQFSMYILATIVLLITTLVTFLSHKYEIQLLFVLIPYFIIFISTPFLGYKHNANLNSMYFCLGLIGMLSMVIMICFVLHVSSIIFITASIISVVVLYLVYAKVYSLPSREDV